VEKWQEEEFPALKAKAKRTGAVIYFADEAGVRSDFHTGTNWCAGRTGADREDDRAEVWLEPDLGRQ
jgi:hypothetical protein